ncbi:hypothetical protein GOODEAATRI_030163 [Goodea atripinnis]|uniref:Uncharacterized protein n=1 Tax=Goodea atripinnis TaxID=208336 RepID=A0ABV0P8W1_9TELE
MAKVFLTLLGVIALFLFHDYIFHWPSGWLSGTKSFYKASAKSFGGTMGETELWYQFANFSAKTTTAENCFICMSHHLPSTDVAVPGEKKIMDCVSSCYNASDPQDINPSENMTKYGFQMITFEKD